MRTFTAMLLSTALLAGTCAALTPLGGPFVAQAAPATATTAFVALDTPLRLLDTREARGLVEPGGTVSVQVAGDAPLPSVATTRVAVLNVTVVGPAGVGFWTVYPGPDLPVASNLNVDERSSMRGADLAMPNLVTVPVGDGGMVTVFSQSGGHVIVDMLGSYQTSDATDAGRFLPLEKPARLLDTRNTAVVQPATVTEVRIPNAGGASAAVLNVTAIGAGTGFWTVFPSDTDLPVPSSLNSLGFLHTSANQAIVKLDTDGDFAVYSQTGGHLIIDLVGLMTGEGAVGRDGLFVPLSQPTRFLDTRNPALNPLGGAQAALPAWNVEVPVATNPAIDGASVAALALNLTVTEAVAEGYVSISPAGANDPAVKERSTSTLNIVRAGQTLPNHATVAVSSRGFDVFVQSGADVLADVSGYYLGAPVAAPYGIPRNVDSTPFGCVGFPAQPVDEVVFGSSRTTVTRAQQRLLDLGFWLTAADGSYGLTTTQAVMAFQKWTGLPRTGRVDETTAVTLNRTLCRPAPTRTGGDLFVVDKGQQLGYIVRANKTLWVLNVSTGGGYAYSETDRKTGAPINDVAITRSGSFRVYRVSDDPAYSGSLGTLYRPRFFSGGIAVHGYKSVPSYPASHGCVRVSNAAMDMIWGISAMPMRSIVIVHD
ncbi:MAG: L,D-transpeptidase family protein [Ilumatobacteraceae bacterium]